MDMKILLWEEERALVSDMNEYRDNLCRHLLNHLSELAGRPTHTARFGPSFKAGWKEWKKRGEQREESSFTVFLNAVNADTEKLKERLYFVFISMTCLLFPVPPRLSVPGDGEKIGM